MHGVSISVAAVAVIVLIVLCWRVGIFVTLLAALAGSALAIIGSLLSITLSGINLLADLAQRIGG